MHVHASEHTNSNETANKRCDYILNSSIIRELFVVQSADMYVDQKSFS